MELKPITCSSCGTLFKLNASADKEWNLQIDLSYDNDNKVNMLINALLSYWRWVAEGRIKYGNTAGRGEPNQYYYDNYHYGIELASVTKGESIYRFSIQTYDSPDGDTWWEGKFVLIGRIIRILEEGYERR